MARKSLADFDRDATLDAADNRDLILALEQRGFTVTRDMPTSRQVQLSDQPSGKIRFGVVSDTHLGHRRQQLTLLRDFYRKAKKWKAQFVLHGGDLVDGQRMHRDQEFELHKHGVTAQGKYAAEVYPDDLPTYVIGGNHDGSGWNEAGANVFDTICARRPDITFLGAPTATFHHGPLAIRLMHPDGGVSYARSYKLQKIVEQFPADDKPHMLLCGHWHVSSHVAGYRSVEAFAVPCFQAQTSFLQRKGLAPVIGGVLFEAEYSERGLEDLTTRWVIYRSTLPEDF